VILKLGSLMGTIDDPTIVGWVGLDLGSQFETKVLDDILRVTGERIRNAAQVDDDTLDSVSFSFNLGLKRLHLVTIERVADVAADVDRTHDCGWSLFALEEVVGYVDEV